MKTGMHQHASLQQTLKMNPRLYQAMDLLYMPLLDLQQHLKQELLSNPFLEMAEAEEESPLDATQVETKPEKNEESGDDEPDWENILLDDGAQGLAAPRDLSPAREYVEPVAPTTRDLSDHLQDQVQMLDLTPRQELMADEFLGNIAGPVTRTSFALQLSLCSQRMNTAPGSGACSDSSDAGRGRPALPLSAT